MRKYVLSTVVVALLSGLAMHAQAASRASLFLEGTIEIICDLFVDPVIGSLTTLDITNGETARLVATVTETTNNPNGYRIDMESVNTGQLQHNNGTSQTAYTIAYDGAAALAPGAVGTPVAVKTVAGPIATTVTATSNVEINVTAGGALPAGAYTDTLIFTMVAL